MVFFKIGVISFNAGHTLLMADWAWGSAGAGSGPE